MCLLKLLNILDTNELADKQNITKNENYEPYNFEEEDLEENDYYYEDDE